MKKCPYCAEKIQDKAIVCWRCGATLTAPELIARAAQPKKKAPVWFVAIVTLALVLACGAIITTQKEKDAKSVLQRTTTPITTPTRTIDKNIKVIMDGAGLSETEAADAFGIVKSIGATSIQSLVYLTNVETLKGYKATLDYSSDYSITFIENKIFGISRNKIVFYARDARGVLDNIANYTLTSDESMKYLVATQLNIQAVLKAPSTASFNTSNWNVVRQKDIVWVQGYVDAENSFGAKLRNNFTAQWSYSTDKGLYLEMAGNVIFGSLQKP